MKNFSLLFFMLLYAQLNYAQITFTQKPTRLQFYPRNTTTNLAKITIGGEVTQTGYDSLVLKTFKTNASYAYKAQALVYNGSQASFNIEQTINAELSNYKIEVYTRNGNQTMLVYQADSIVAGDAYIINGQSNALTSPDLGSVADSLENTFIRTFGKNIFFGDTLDLLNNLYWHPATYAQNGFGIGYWGIWLANRLAAQYQMPIAVINGAIGGVGLASMQKNLQQPTDPKSSYGRVLLRTKQAKIDQNIRGYCFHQGEAGDNDYKAQWLQLYNQLNADFNIEKFYLFQTKINDCNGYLRDDILVREAQRQLIGTPKITLISTNDLPHNTDKCHFSGPGHYLHAQRLYNLVRRDLYGFPNNNPHIDSPNPMRAYVSYPDSTLLVIETTRSTDLLVTEPSAYKGFIFEGANTSRVDSVYALGNKIYLRLSHFPKNASGVSYVPPFRYTQFVGAVPYIVQEFGLVKNTIGIGLLSFHNLKIDNLNPSFNNLFQAQYQPGGLVERRLESQTSLWLDAQKGISNALGLPASHLDSVRSWVDVSNGLACKPAFKKPIYDAINKQIYFYDSPMLTPNALRTRINSTDNPFSLFAVLLPDSNVTIDKILGRGQENGFYFYQAAWLSNGLDMPCYYVVNNEYRQLSGNLINPSSGIVPPVFPLRTKTLITTLTIDNIVKGDMSIGLNGKSFSNLLPTNFRKQYNYNIPIVLGGAFPYLTQGAKHVGIKEMIVYGGEFNLLKRQMIENYLAAKHQTNLDSIADFYSEQTIGFGHQLAGIGKKYGNRIDTSCTEGLCIINRGFLNTSGNMLIFAHNNASNITNSNADTAMVFLPNTTRLTRQWYAQTTDSSTAANRGLVEMQFNLSLDAIGNASNWSNKSLIVRDSSNQWRRVSVVDTNYNTQTKIYTFKVYAFDVKNKYFTLCNQPIILNNPTIKNVLSGNIWVYPNPIEQYKTLNIGFKNCENQPTSIQIRDVLGKLHYQNTITIPNLTDYTYQIETSGLVSKMYLVQIKNGLQTYTHKIIIR